MYWKYEYSGNIDYESPILVNFTVISNEYLIMNILTCALHNVERCRLRYVA